MRLFFGIPAPFAESYQNIAKTSIDQNIRWTSAVNLHITLVFLGQVSSEQLPGLITASEVSIPAFTLRTASLSIKNKRMVWLRLQNNEIIQQLFGTLEQAAADTVSYRKEQRQYNPHITLARSKELIRKVEFPAIETSEQHVDRYILYNSVPTKTGSAYQIVHEFLLK